MMNNIKPLLRAGLQSGTIMSLADIVTQLVVEGKHMANTTNDNDIVIKGGKHVMNNNNNKNDNEEYYDNYNLNRTLRWTIAGLTLHGPYFFVGFSIVDKYFSASTASAAAAASASSAWKVVAKKTAIAQFILFPPYLVALFGLMGILENHPNISQKIQQHVPEAFVGGCIYWPIANGINFAFISQNLRVPYLALSAGIWNSYLSWTNNK